MKDPDSLKYLSNNAGLLYANAYRVCFDILLEVRPDMSMHDAHMAIEGAIVEMVKHKRQEEMAQAYDKQPNKDTHR